MKQMEFTILGQGYILGCEDGGEELLKAAVETVDREMTAIRDGGKVKARERIAVLSALNLAYRLAAVPSAPGASGKKGAKAADSGTDKDNASTALTPQAVDALVNKLDAALGADGHLL